MSQRLALRLLSGSKEGSTVPIAEGGVTVGRRPGNDVVLDDASVSGQHARLTVEGGDLWVQDLGSTNGTRVGGRKVERMSLLAGDEIAFGNVRAQVVEAPAAAPAAMPAQAAAPTPANFLDDVDEISLEEPAPRAVPTARPAPVPSRASADASAAGAGAARPRAAAAAPSPATRSAAAAAPELDLPDEEPMRADLDAFERRQKSSPVVTIAIALVVAIGVGAGAWLTFGRGGSDGESSGPVVAVSPIAGNLLGADWSFEEAEAASGWSSDESAPSVFARGRSGALSGRAGLAATFVASADGVDWAAESSVAVRIQPGRTYEASAAVEVEGAARARVGIQFLAEDGSTAILPTTWGVAVRAGEESERVACSALAPSGAAFARAVLAGAGDGEVVLDDAALVASERPIGPGPLGEFVASTSSASGGALVLTRLDALVVLATARGDDGPLASDATLSASVVEGAPRLSVTVGGATPRGVELFTPNTDSGPRPFAFVADGQYRSNPGDVEASGVTQLLVGRGLELVRFEFGAPVALRRRVGATGARVEIDLGSTGAFDVQLAFGAERDSAVTLAAASRRAEREGRLGDALDGWSRLLATYGFEAELVAEAETALGRLTTLGATELDAIARDVERADFFGLAGIYDECSRRLAELRARFADTGGRGNSVVAAADALAEAIAASRDALDSDRGEDDGEARRAIRGYLERNGLGSLAERVGPATPPNQDADARD